MIPEDVKKNVMAKVKQFFKPEFINRLDDIILFNPLSEDSILKIGKLLIDEVSKRMKDKNLTLKPTEEVLKFVKYCITFRSKTKLLILCMEQDH